MSSQLSWLMGLQRFGMKPGLEVMERLLDRLDRPERGIRAVLVGGTNGKGSTASLLAGMLSAAGIRTGLFISPHLTRVMERFTVDGYELPQERLEAALERVRPAAEELGASFFEVMVACAWLLFRESGCRVAVLEVGLGGRFDATNASEPELSVITNVALDHTEILGDTREKIAADKAWLMRSGRLTLTAAQEPALAVLDGHAQDTGARLQALDRDFHVRVRSGDWSGSQLEVEADGWRLGFHIPLVGRHQARNAALAALAARSLGAADAAIRNGAAAASWPGRLERLAARQRTWLLDGAHNPAGAASLRAALADLRARPAVLILGLGSDKDSAGVIRELQDVAPLVIATRASLSPRALPVDQLAERLPPGALQAEDAAAALDLAVRSSKQDELVVVAGSLYLLGELRPLLSGQQAEDFERWQ